MDLVIFSPGVSDEEEVEQDLKDSKVNGLLIVGHEDKLLVICIVSEKTLYLLDPKIQECLSFLKKQMYNLNIRLCTVDGLSDARLLYEATRLKMGPTQIDLVTYELQYEIRKYALGKVAYKEGSLRYARLPSTIRPQRTSYQKLVHKYISQDIDVELAQDELEALGSLKYLKQKAGLALIRRASPLVPLAKKMFAIEKEERIKPTRAFLKMTSLSVAEREEYERKQDNTIRELYFYSEKIGGLSSSE